MALGAEQARVLAHGCWGEAELGWRSSACGLESRNALAANASRQGFSCSVGPYGRTNPPTLGLAAAMLARPQWLHRRVPAARRGPRGSNPMTALRDE